MFFIKSMGLIFIFLSCSYNWAKCENYYLSYLSWHTKTKQIFLENRGNSLKEVCSDFMDDSMANVLVKIKFQNKVFLERKIFIPIDTFWENISQGKYLISSTNRDNRRSVRKVFFSTLLPKNYKLAEIVFYNLKGTKILGRGIL